MLASNPVTSNLIKARELIADEKNWCTRTAQIGDRMCAVGALRVARGLTNGSGRVSCLEIPEYSPLRKASIELFRDHPAFVNDRNGHAAVMRMFNRAIELSLQEPTE